MLDSFAALADWQIEENNGLWAFKGNSRILKCTNLFSSRNCQKR